MTVKKLFLSLFLMWNIITFSQKGNVTVEYKSIIQDDRDLYGAFDYERTKLITNGVESLYIETALDTIVSIDNSDTYYNDGSENSKKYYKNLKDKYIIYDKNYGVNGIIKDENYNIQWVITENTKTILGYNCQEAIGDFRGRKYKAYFLKDIPFQNGPHKFDGLPGLILAVESLDNAVKIEAQKIVVDEGIIMNPFSNVKLISWNDFLRKYKLYFDKITSYRGEEGVSMIIAKRYIEVFID